MTAGRLYPEIDKDTPGRAEDDHPYNIRAQVTLSRKYMRTARSETQQTTELVLPTKQLLLQDLPFLNAVGKCQGDTIILDHSPKQYRLKNPVSVDIAKILTLGQKGLAQYIVQSLLSNRPTLIPFVLDNTSLIEMTKYLLRARSGSSMSLYAYTNTVHQYSERLGTSPDEIIADAKPHNLLDPQRIHKHRKFLEDCLAELQDQGRSPGRLHGYAKQIRCFYKCNGVELRISYLPIPRPVRKDRAPTQEELAKLLDISALREKLIVSMLALGGFREGTLTRLQYRHVKEDLERNITPLHIHVEAEITKGKYHDYDSFLPIEGVHYLSLYLEHRRKGLLRYIKPEEITDESPLIRDEMSDFGRPNAPRPLGEKQIYKVIHQLYGKIGLLKPGRTDHILRVHSLRKFFKTQLVSLGVPGDYVDYMMGHTVDTYHDIQSKGVEFLREVYARAGLSINPRSQQNKLQMAANFLRSIGMDPEKALMREAFAEPHRITASTLDRDDHHTRILLETLKRRIEDELSKS